MIPQLTEDQRQALEEQGDSPIYIADPKTNTSYVLLRAEVYERYKAVFEEEFDPRETYSFVDRVMADDDANDPTLADYQSVPARRSQRSEETLWSWRFRTSQEVEARTVPPW